MTGPLNISQIVKPNGQVNTTHEEPSLKQRGDPLKPSSLL